MESRHPLFLGFFVVPYHAGEGSLVNSVFLPASNEGTDLKEGKWGYLDDSLSFLDPRIGPVFVVCSSNGFLLCVTINGQDNHNMTYIICNPVTREFDIIPEPHKSYPSTAMAFICKGGEDDIVSLNRIHYEIVRAGVMNWRQLTTTVEIETFSSTTGEWTGSCLSSASPFRLGVAKTPAFVMEDVIYWRTCGPGIAAYDRTRDFVELIEIPKNARKTLTWSDHFGVSEGKIHYLRHDKINLEVWVLEDIQRGKWLMKHRVNFRVIFQENPDAACSLQVTRVEHLHPQNSQLLLLLLFRKPYWYDFRDGKLTGVGDYNGSWYRCLPYERPSEQFV